MSKRIGWHASVGAIVCIAAGIALFVQETSIADGTRLKAGDHELSGPFHHGNLTICLVHGKDQLKGRKFMMLSEALQKKQFTIYETQTVNDLVMENLSEIEVIILSGDILKGGQQDRVAQYDQIVPPKSGKKPLRVFCVERTASRWMKPLTEKDKTFHSCPGQLCSNSLRLANRFYTNQSGVWMKVVEAQEKLAMSAKVDVKVKKSDSSLALSLKVKQVQEGTDRYVQKLQSLPEDKNDVVGYVFAVNGKVLSADVYGSPKLFHKVWPRLIRASALEAFAERSAKKFTPPDLKAFQTFVEESKKGEVNNKDAGKGLRQTKNEKSRIVNFETFGGHAASKKMPALRKQAFKY